LTAPVLAVLAAFPWVERRLTGDGRVHNLLDRPAMRERGEPVA
jgi:hypothetical protein